MLFLMIRVRVRAFGGLKDALGSDCNSVVLREGATVADLLVHLRERYRSDLFQGIAVSVNAEYAVPARPLAQDDEVGLLPPVSGGAGAPFNPPPLEASSPADSASYRDHVHLTRDPIDTENLVARAKHPGEGALVVFDGIVRQSSRGRSTLHLEYEAYEAMALKQMQELAAEARERFGVDRVMLVHRLGRLAVGETSVLIVAGSAHRAPAFDACRWLIDTLKKTVPIWKRETFVDGAVWADGEPFPAELRIEGPDAS
jgi:MoaE-MoaD fusion protein